MAFSRSMSGFQFAAIREAKLTFRRLRQHRSWVNPRIPSTQKVRAALYFWTKLMAYADQVAIDLLTNFSAEHFAYAVRSCRTTVNAALEKLEDSNRDRARASILHHLDLQLSRAESWVQKETDLLALVARTLIELGRWTRYISKGEEYVESFLRETAIDEYEIFKAIARADGDTGAFPPLAVGKRISPEQSDKVDEFIYKVCSKQIHPSSWILNNREMLNNDDHRKLLAGTIMQHAWYVVEGLQCDL